MWKNFVGPGRPQVTILLMRFARWMTKAIKTGLEYMILTAFPLQQWLHKRASTLGYTYTKMVQDSTVKTELLR